MRTYEDIGEFTLNKETDKKSERSPDYYGRVTIDGKEFRLGGWVRESEHGKFISGKVSVVHDDEERATERQDAARDDAEPATPPAAAPNADEDIPF